MPCFDPRPTPEIEAAKLEIDKLTRLLCEASKLLGYGYETSMSKELLQWVISHRVADYLREKDG